MSDEREVKEEMRRTKRKVNRVGLTWLTILILISNLFIVYYVAMFIYEMKRKNTRNKPFPES